MAFAVGIVTHAAHLQQYRQQQTCGIALYYGDNHIISQLLKIKTGRHSTLGQFPLAKIKSANSTKQLIPHKVQVPYIQNILVCYHGEVRS